MYYLKHGIHQQAQHGGAIRFDDQDKKIIEEHAIEAQQNYSLTTKKQQKKRKDQENSS